RASGRLRAGDVLVEFERVAFAKEASDRALWAGALAAMLLAILVGGSVRIVRLLANGRGPGTTPSALSQQAADTIRVHIGPDAPVGTGSGRVQAGKGDALHGWHD